jgi:SAM-dependent methyltransferase
MSGQDFNTSGQQGGFPLTTLNWNAKADYLMQTRGLYLNDDYLAFLVRQVWKLDVPTDVIDFGCGFGYMGLKLLPLLPVDSSYTGVDLADALLAKAREIFDQTPYRTRFFEADVTQIALEEHRYDLAVCHALLLHVPDPMTVLQQMKRCVKPGGLVVCIEPHWLGCMASTHYHGDPQSAYVKLGILQDLFEKDVERTGKDGNIGIKLPVYMDEVGLTEIECRLSDKVNLLLPHQAQERQQKMVESLRAEGHGSAPLNRDAFLEKLRSLGLSAEQALQQYEAECAFVERYERCHVRQQVVYAPSMMISFGRTPGPAQQGEVV